MDRLIGKSLGRYHVIEPLGEGGMAAVYRAFDRQLERTVAVKVIRSDRAADPDFHKRFTREAKALAKLEHPNIVDIKDYGEQDGIPYLVMPYLPGGTLKDLLEERGGPISYQEAARILAPMARALAYAHARNLIHRDIKPANILISEGGVLRLSDFGIAKVLEETAVLTGTSSSIGTPQYMPPEQWANNVVYATDIYALGVVFYEMIVGRCPYVADTVPAIMHKHIYEPLPRPREYGVKVPEAVELVLVKALAKEPAGRYADMAAFAAALESLVDLAAAPQEDLEETVVRAPRQAGSSNGPPLPAKQPGILTTALIGGAAGLVVILVAVVFLLATGIIGVGPARPEPDEAVSAPSALPEPANTPTSSPADAAAPAEPAPADTPLPEEDVTSEPETADNSALDVIEAAWRSSGHADQNSDSFTHWNDTEPPQVVEACAKCHSGPGLELYLTAPADFHTLSEPVAVGTVIECETCHNAAAESHSRVQFASGVIVSGLGREAVCLECHQMRFDQGAVNGQINEAGASSLDTAYEGLTFDNPHYQVAASSVYGFQVRGFVQYEGKNYRGPSQHFGETATCLGCHDPHSLKLQFDVCAPCHGEIDSVLDVRAIRSPDSLLDYDGDGNTNEGLYYEIFNLQHMLIEAIYTYAARYSDAIVYDEDAYPYFFYDTNSNGVANDDELDPVNRYSSWTPRLLRAAHTLQAIQKDPGAYVHNGKYIIQVQYDALESLLSISGQELTGQRP